MNICVCMHVCMYVCMYVQYLWKYVSVVMYAAGMYVCIYVLYVCYVCMSDCDCLITCASPALTSS